MYLGQWGVSLDRIKRPVLTQSHIIQSTLVHNCAVMGAGVIEIALKHTLRVMEQSILTSRAGFAYLL